MLDRIGGEIECGRHVRAACNPKTVSPKASAGGQAGRVFVPIGQPPAQPFGRAPAAEVRLADGQEKLESESVEDVITLDWDSSRKQRLNSLIFLR